MTSTQHPKLLLMGPSAVTATAKLMLSARPTRVNSSFGVVDLVPGSVWQGNRVLIDCSDMVVHYMVGTQLYEWNTQSFVRDAWLTGMGIGASQAQWLVHLAKVEREFAMGLFVPVAGIIGLTCAQILVVYANHRKAFAIVQKHASGIIADLRILRRENPTLCEKVLAKVGGEIVSHIPDGISAEDIAFWLGRILKGAIGALPDLKATKLAKILVTVTAIVGLTHSLGISARSGQAAVKQADVETTLKQLQVAVTSADAAKIALELNAAKDSKQALKRLQESITAVMPSVLEIFEAWENARG